MTNAPAVFLKTPHPLKSFGKMAALFTMLILVSAVAATNAGAQSFSGLYTFEGLDGGNPTAPLVQGTDGNLYGTTSTFGTLDGVGTVFKITPAGTLTTIYTFCQASATCLDGSNPVAPVIQAIDGNLYGTTFAGGSGNGTVFGMTPDGTPTMLHRFNVSDGANPAAGLVQGIDGNFYGTTSAGGANGYGTVFKISPTGKLTTLYSFNSTDGASPQGGLIQTTDGNFYGTTNAGGANNSGTVFKITPSSLLTTIYSFCSQPLCADGSGPVGGLVQGIDSKLYGTTCCDGVNGNGTIFKMTASGTLTTLHSFDWTDGASPLATLIQATDGNLYGTSNNGGYYGPFGTMFEVTPAGTFTTLYNFCPEGNACSDGARPAAGLVQHTNGIFYGTAEYGGSEFDLGTIFSESVGLRPFVRLSRPTGKVGQTVGILGQGFSGATNVWFAGIPTSFTVVSDNYLTAPVPEGATTGFVAVGSPKGTLTSSRPFQVTPQILSFDPPSGPVGTVVTINGVSLTQTTGVGFGNYVLAKFTVGSDTQISATVPQGAATGPVGVLTLGGVAVSSGTFTVTP